MLEKIHRTIEETRQKEREIVQYREAARVIALQMEPISSIISQLVPQTEAIKDGVLPQINVQLSATIMEVKNEKSTHPNDITPPGGRLELSEDPEAGSEQEQVTQRAAQILWDELHFNLTDFQKLPHLTRNIDIPIPNKHKRGKTRYTRVHEHWVIVKASPDDQQVHVFRPRHKIKQAIRFTPRELEMFISTEVYRLNDGTTGHLLDSISADDNRRQANLVFSDKTKPVHLYRAAIVAEAYKYEAEVLFSVVQRYMVIASLQNVPQSLVQRYQALHENHVPTDYSSAVQIISECHALLSQAEASYNKNSFQGISKFRHVPRDEYTRNGVSMENIRQRELFIQEFVHAYDQVMLEQTMELTRKTGPEQPYILAKIIPKLDRLMNVEYAILTKNAWIKHLIDVPLKVFGIDPTKPNWHTKLLAKLKEIRTWEHDENPHRRASYTAYAEAMNRAFCTPDNPGEVPQINPEDLGLHSEGAQAYQDHLKKTITPISTPDVVFAISTNPYGSATQETLELVFRMWGLNQYNETNTKLPLSEQTAAWIKLLDELTDKQVREIWKKATAITIKPLRATFDRMFGDPVGGHIVDDHPYPRYIMNAKVQKFLSVLQPVTPIRIANGQIVELAQIPISVVSNMRVKDINELKRKWFERSSMRADGSVDLTDFFGFFYMLDDIAFKEELIARFPFLNHATQRHAVEAIVAQWQRFAASLILQGMEHMINNTYPKPMAITRDKGRVTTPILNGIVPMKMQDGGSVSSIEICRWLKYVLHVKYTDHTKEVEIQFYPSRIDLKKKILDDKRFRIKRLFNKPKNRYPPIELEFANQEGFEAMLDLHYQALDRAQHRPKWMNWLASMFLYSHLYFRSDESVIYEYDR